MPKSLAELALDLGAGGHESAKPTALYAIYERYFADLTAKPITLLELGVHAGVSLKVWAEYFQTATIIGVDLANPGPDFSSFPSVIYETGDQGDAERLRAIADRHAPGGFDIIIDDAAHVGYLAALSYAVLFPLLKPGGFYVVEDWGTGYFDDWLDGGHYQKFAVEPMHGMIPKRLASHDFGMVGFVKSLVDDVAGDHLKPTLRSPALRPDAMEYLHFYKQFAIIKKLVE